VNKLILLDRDLWINPNLLCTVQFYPAPYTGDPQRQATIKLKFMGYNELALYGEPAERLAQTLAETCYPFTVTSP
jgi:hypothetical protein